MFNVMTKTNKYPRKHRHVERGPRQPNYKLRRLIAGTALAGAGLAGFNAVNADHEGSFRVDPSYVGSLDPAERAEKFDEFRISPGSQNEDGVAPNLYGVAEEYKERYGLRTDVRDIVADLVEQNGDTSVVHPGDTFYLPRQDVDG